MQKKFICVVCGYVHEGNEAPENAHFAVRPVQSSRKWTMRLALNSLLNTKSEWPKAATKK